MAPTAQARRHTKRHAQTPMRRRKLWSIMRSQRLLWQRRWAPRHMRRAKPRHPGPVARSQNPGSTPAAPTPTTDGTVPYSPPKKSSARMTARNRCCTSRKAADTCASKETTMVPSTRPRPTSPSHGAGCTRHRLLHQERRNHRSGRRHGALPGRRIPMPPVLPTWRPRRHDRTARTDARKREPLRSPVPHHRRRWPQR